MRFMSFALTADAVRRREKAVTRRLGWLTAMAGDMVQPVVKGQGLKKGEHVERIGGPIRFTSVRREPLNAPRVDNCCCCGCSTATDCPTAYHCEGYAGSFVACARRAEVRAEGFPELTWLEFEAMFREHNNCHANDVITRIEFEYV